MGWARLWPALGIVGWVVAFTGLAVHGYPAIDASPQQLASWTSSTDSTHFSIGISIEAVGLLIFVFFVAWLCGVTRRTGGTSWLLGLALASSVAWAAVSIGGNGVWTALLDAGRHGVDSSALVAIRDVAQETYNASNFILALTVIAVGLANLRGSALPSWLAWAALVIGVLMVPPPLSMPLTLVFLLWVAVVSVYFLIRPPVISAERSVESKSVER